MAQDCQDPLMFALSAAGLRSFDTNLDSPVPGRQAARCTSLSKPLPGCRAPACELCCLAAGAAAARWASCKAVDTLCRALAALECEVRQPPSTGAFQQEVPPIVPCSLFEADLLLHAVRWTSDARVQRLYVQRTS
jgi:hypothetical protein